MIDVRDLPSVPTAGDFVFRVGNTSDPGTWVEAPQPAEISLRRGAGRDGSDRITLIWPHSEIRNEWLQVTVRETPRTGLASDDVFYFGNAIGETGDDPANAIVNAVDAIAARNHPRDPDDMSPITNPFDFNRDRLVDTLDVALAQQNATSPLTALQLISFCCGKDFCSFFG